MTTQLPKMSIGDYLRALGRILAGRPRTPASLEGNEFLKMIHQRRSVRHFTHREIPDDVFAAILEAGRLAPSTINLQTWSFAIFDAETWRDAFNQTIPFKAQRAVIVMGDAHRNRAVLGTFPHTPLVEYTVAVMNASLAAMNMNIAAEVLGVASVMLSETGRAGLLDAGFLKQTLSLPEDVFPIMTIVFGYPSKASPPMPPKLALDQICFDGDYKETDSKVLEDWMSQMVAGYKASYPLSSLDIQLKVYKSKIMDAEKELNQMVFHNQAHDQ